MGSLVFKIKIINFDEGNRIFTKILGFLLNRLLLS